MKREISKLAAALGLVLGIFSVAQPAMADNGPDDEANGIEIRILDIVRVSVDLGSR